MKALLEKEVPVERVSTSEDRSLPVSDGLQKEKSICSTCLHAGHCIYQGRSTGPILFCEEFESEKGKSGKTDILKGQEMEGSEDYFKGLCANCENRNTCMFADSISGIWHCEEYK